MTSIDLAPATPPGTAPASDGEYGIVPAGDRLDAATRVGRVVLQVADLARSLAWYEGVLGFRTVGEAAGEATLGADDGTPLVVLRERAGATPVPRGGRLGLYHFAILLPERAALGRFVAHLAQLGVRAGASDHFVSEALYLTDPDGLGIEVYADRPRDTWRRRGRELHMDSTPLDFAGLVAAGGGAAWSGMPAGTTIGHVHLHVGDLDAASAFYHAALGLDTVVWSYPGALFFSAGGYHHHLGTNVWAAGAARATADDARLLEWELVLPDADAIARAAAQLASAGYEVTRDGDAALVQDPWGTTLRLADARRRQAAR